MNDYNTYEHNMIRRGKGTRIFIIYVMITFLIYVLPYMKVTIPYIIAGVVMLAFLPLAMIKRKKWMNYGALLVGLSSVVFIFDFLVGGYSFSEALNELIRNIRFFIPVLWTTYAIKYCNVRQCKCFMACFGATISLILYKTMIALEQDPWIARILARDKMQDTSEIRTYRLQNVGGFEFSYMMGIVTIALVWTAIKAQKITVKILCVCAALISYNYIIQTMYTTLLLLTTVGVLILLICCIKNPAIKAMIIIASCILPFGLSSIFENLSGVFTDSLLSTKFMQIHDSLSGGGAEALGSRPEHILQAIRNWLHSPLIGGYNVGTTAHSTIFAILERNGIIGIFAYFFMFHRAWKIISVDLKREGVEQLLFNIVMLYVLALSFFNPIGYIFEITIMAFYVTPIWTILIMRRIKREESISISI